VGRLVLFHQYPEESTNVAMKIMIEDYESREAEQEVFGLTHEEVGAELCKIWGFSEKLTGCVSSHHTTTLDPKSDRLTIVIHIADKLSETFETGDDPIPVYQSLEPTYTESIFNDDVDLNTIFAEAEEEFQGMSSYIIN
jgi:HD-like signal output (HDOD) protein